MKTIRQPIIAILSTFALLPLTGMAAEKSPVDWVDPRIDTVKPRWFYFASASRPFGMVNLSPDTNTDADWNSGYRHGDDTVQCLSHVHCWQLAGIAVMPLTAKSDPLNYASKFSHDDETIRPGYHKLFLQTHGVTTELTSTTRVGFHRHSYPAGERARMLFDLARPLMGFEILAHEARAADDRRSLTGFTTLGTSFRRPKPLTVYFHAEFSVPFEQVGDGKDGKVLVDFGELAEPLLMKIGLSYTGMAGARANLEAELPHWDFDRVRKESADEWNEMLGRIKVEGGSDAAKVKLYTDLWHALLGRRIISDVDGSYPDNTGPTTIVRKSKRPHLNFDGWWGSHWSINILWPLAWPEVMGDFAETMVDIYRNGGVMPRCAAGGNHSYVMSGDAAVPFFAAAWQKGVRGWDAETAYEGLRKNAFPGGIRDRAGYERRDNPNGGGMEYYVDRGYVPEDIPDTKTAPQPPELGWHRAGAAMTLEYAYQDWCVAQLARALGKDEDAALFERRALNYRNIWNKESGWMHPRRMDGSWYEPFAPVGTGTATKGFIEGNSAVWTFYVPHDLPGLAKLFGGPDKAIARLEENFTKAIPFNFIGKHDEHAEAWIDYENQPSTAVAHLFAHFGQPWRSQYWVRRVHAAAFSNITPFGGYNGDEDQGQMGALSTLMAIGLFDVSGGVGSNPHYDLSAPLFDKVTIRLHPDQVPGNATGDRSFTIVTRNNHPDHVYIQSARLNGEPWNSFQLPHAMFIQGGTLELELGPEPNKEWGVK